MPSITNVYESHWRARKVVSELEAAGIPSSNISMLFHKYVGDKPASGEDASATAAGTGVGAVVGGGAGLLAGIGLLAIPGLGPIVAAGWWAPTITGVLAGGATGGIVGALVKSGVSEDHAHVLSEAVRRYGADELLEVQRLFRFKLDGAQFFRLESDVGIFRDRANF